MKPTTAKASGAPVLRRFSRRTPRRGEFEKIFGMFIPLLIIFGTFVTRMEVARDDRRNPRKALWAE
jgi:hypothetical protein